MRTVLIIVGCITLAIASWITWGSRRTPEHALQRTETTAKATLAPDTVEELALAPTDRVKAVGRASASSTSKTIMGFRVIAAMAVREGVIVVPE
ncbi:MAG: hypothetical protein SGI72_08755 [Planctomycetota bacterium]|nr:hypothetical protein [Planctomycetota bacterium]